MILKLKPHDPKLILQHYMISSTVGYKKVLETIVQLLGYLNWYDSKTSTVIIVQNKDINSVIENSKYSAEWNNQEYIACRSTKKGENWILST